MYNDVLTEPQITKDLTDASTEIVTRTGRRHIVKPVQKIGI